jgi:solute:Na+ symporter, SSS family
MPDMDILSTNFGVLDIVIVAVYTVASLAIGVVANKLISNESSYLIGGGASGPYLNAASWMGTGLGLVTLMYASIEGFHNGLAYLAVPLMGFIVGILLGSTGFVISRLRRLNLLTLPEYLEIRYSRGVRILGGTLCAAAGILNMGLFPKLGATFVAYSTGLTTVSGIDPSLLINIIMTILILFVLAYTIMGGMVAVIITDYFQFIVLGLGLCLGLYLCLRTPGIGWDSITTAMFEHRGDRMFNPFSGEGNYGYVWVLFNLIISLAGGIAWAPEATRILTARDEKASKATFLLGAPGWFAKVAIPALWGMAAFTFISQSPDMTAYFFPNGIENSSPIAAQAMPLMLGKIIPSGLLGLLVAGLVAAFMSTHDSYFLCWGSVITRDIINPIRGNTMTSKQQVSMTRIIIFLIGGFLLSWGVWYPLPDSVWSYMAVSGAIYLTGATVVIIGGMYWSRASTVGAYAGLLGGSIAVVGLFLGPINRTISGLGGGEGLLTPEMVGLSSFIFALTLFVVMSLICPNRQASLETHTETSHAS